MNQDFFRRLFDVTAWSLGLVFSLFVVADAMAAERGRGAPLDPLYAAECGSCHVPYAPRLLATPAWERIIAGLDRHFGVDAGVDAATAAKLRAYLAANAPAPGGKRDDPAATRITQARWFVHEHRKVLATPAGAAPRASDCAACHPQAARGLFDEHDVRVPRA